MKKRMVGPIQKDGRCAFCISWYATEEQADKAGQIIFNRNDSYNGGFFHGAPCGRDKTFDMFGKFAVTHSGSAPMVEE